MGERDVALQAVKEGYVSIAPDMRGLSSLKLAENSSKVSSCYKLHMRAILYGRTLVGERVWDIMKLIDFAQTRKEIDFSKIAITGNSAGGTVSLFTAAVYERIKICVPSCSFCTFQESIANIEHCACNYIPNLLKNIEMCDLEGLVAPRYLLIVSGIKDEIFPIDEVEKSFAVVQDIYKIANSNGCCELHIGDGEHRYYKKPVWEYIKSLLC